VFRLGYLNGALWAIGNGLTSGSLITYLAIDLGAQGVGVSIVLAIQAMVGTLRIAAPTVIGLVGGARRTCLLLTTASYVIIFLLPIVTLAGSPLRGTLPPVATLITVLCVHQLLEHLGTVALWTWWADLVPQRIRGRYFGRRNIWQLAALIPAVWLGGRCVDLWKQHHAGNALGGYAIVTATGATFLLASIVPLVLMPERLGLRSPRMTIRGLGLSTLLAPFASPSFRRVLGFGVWFSLVNGLTQSAQNIYPKRVLDIGLTEQAALVTIMRLGQMGYSAWVGPASDRYGNRPVLVVSQLVQAAGMLFFFLSAPEQTYWLYGAWICWSAFAGINICAPNLLLKLAPAGLTAAYVGTYWGVTGSVYASATLAGGYVHDLLAKHSEVLAWLPAGVDFYHGMFLCAWLARSMAVVMLLRVAEPGAWTLSQIVQSSERKRDATEPSRGG
jgi:hypothetical protein